MRVIAGRFGGRPLRAPRGRGTRPTSDRVRESLFSVLGDLTGCRVADLYAGTGALGIEALSRGAAWVTFVEHDPAALAALRANLKALELTAAASVVPQPVERAGASLGAEAPYDLVLCDPPWAEVDHAVSTLLRLLPTLALPAGSRVVIEHAARSPLVPPEGWPLPLVDRRRWGDTAVSIYQSPH
jgi:16S rRNA (guanine966-N2)-methyltransferase